MGNDQSKLAAGLADALRQHPQYGPRIREIEGIEKEVADVIEAVDLDIAFSPVLMNAGDKLENATDVAYKAEDGRYVFDNPYKVVTADELKVMRARFLIMRGKQMDPIIRRAFQK